MFFTSILRFYIDGFREMKLGRTLWLIILAKLFIMFAVLKTFFFPDPLSGKDDVQRRKHFLYELTS